MKTIILANILFIAVFITVSAQQKDTLLNIPNERITVEKEYDENGNLIRFDSTYIFEWHGDSLIAFPKGNGFTMPHGLMDIDNMLKGFFNDSSLTMPFGGRWQDNLDNHHELLHQFRHHFSDSTFAKPFSLKMDSAFMFPFGFKEFDDNKMHDLLKDFDFGFDNLPRQFYENEEQQKEWDELRKKQEEELKRFREKWKPSKKSEPNTEFQKL